MEQSVLDRAAYSLAKKYLLSFRNVGLTDAILEEYLNPNASRPASLREIYRQLLESAQNRGMGPGVIGNAIQGIDNLGDILCNFDPGKTTRKYGSNWKQLRDDVKTRLRPKGKFRQTSRSIWPLFCRTITSGAKFLSQFTAADEFYRWVDAFVKDERIRPALPMLLSLEIDGIGFPLACDFLKDSGYFEFGKPDVHVKTIFKGLGLVDRRANDYDVFKAIVRVAKSQKVTPYNVDKLFWLVGSGYLHEHKHLGKKGRIHTDRGKFIREALARLKRMSRCS